MWLKDIACINYKSLKKTHIELSRDAANVIIGINDCGKSTTLQAIGLLFSSPRFKFNFSSDFQSRTDLSNSRCTQAEYEELINSLAIPAFSYNESESIIIGKLEIEDADLEQAALETYSPILRWTIEQSKDNCIWLAAVSDTTAGTTQSYILTSDIVENGEPVKLLTESLANLKNRADAAGLDVTKSDPNRPGGNTKEEYIAAICADHELSPIWIPYERPHFRKDAEVAYPEYQYLDWNISFSELENVAKVAVQNQIEEQINSTKEFADARANEAQAVVNEELEKFRATLAETLPSVEAIKATVMFKVDSKLTDIFVNKTNTDGDIFLEAQGDGIKRQIWFALLKWKATQNAVAGAARKKYIWCFDEPETHLYPRAQREFYEVLRKIASEEFQLVISTHSTVFIDRARLSEIKKFELLDSYTAVSTCNDVAGVFQALDIRNSDFLFYDKFLVVEGDTEDAIIPHMFTLITGKTLQESGVQLIKLGGKNKRNEHCTIFESMLVDFNKSNENVIYLLDGDVRFEMTPAELEKFGNHRIGRQDIEDSIPLTVWEAIIRQNFDEGIISSDELAAIYNGISGDEELPKNKKFYAALKSFLKSKLGQGDRHLVDDHLPEKGRELGDLLKEFIVEPQDVPETITAAFAALIQ